MPSSVGRNGMVGSARSMVAVSTACVARPITMLATRCTAPERSSRPDEKANRRVSTRTISGTLANHTR